MAEGDPRVVIVGAGPAGLRAAIALAEAGLRPILVDEAPRIGGQIYRQPPPFPGFLRERRDLYGAGAGRAGALFSDFEHAKRDIDYQPGWLVFDAVDRVLHATDGDQRKSIEWDSLILATGATDRIVPCAGWTKPGVFTLGGAQIALKFQGCTIGRRVVFAGLGPLLFLAAHQYARAGSVPTAIIVPSRFSDLMRVGPDLCRLPLSLWRGLRWMVGLRRQGVPILFGHHLQRIQGDKRVAAVEIADGAGTIRHIDCDAVALGYGLKPETQLADLLGVNFRFDERHRQYIPDTDDMGRAVGQPGVYLAGDGAGVLGAEAAEAQGRLAAHAVLTDLGRTPPAGAWPEDVRIIGKWRAYQLALSRAFPFPSDLAARIPDDVIICRCEGVEARNVRDAAGVMGAGELNRIKAYTRLGMGRCQGRICGPVAAEVLAAKIGTKLEQVGRLRTQPPVKPVGVGALAHRDGAG